MSLVDFLKDKSGEKFSAKRLGGLSCIASACALKYLLVFYGLRHVTATSFERLDFCVDSLLYVGSALLAGGLLEMFQKRK